MNLTRTLKGVAALSLVGLGISSYLTWVYTAGGVPVCLGSGGCSAVQTSAYAWMLGLPIPAYGAALYLVLIAGALLALRLPALRLPAQGLPAQRLPAQGLPAQGLPAVRPSALRLPAQRLPALRPSALREQLSLALFGLALTGVLFSAYLTYLEFFVIHAICLWCITSAIVMLLVFLLTIPLLRAQG